MAIYSKALYQLRQSVAYSLDDCVVAQVTSNATNTTVISTTLTKGDDYYNGWDCHFYLGTHKDVSREVTDFTASSDTLTIAPATTGVTDTTDYFELHKRFLTSQYNDAINRAIELGKDEYLLDKVDETTALVTNQEEYNVATGFRYINSIQVEDKTSGEWYDSGLIDKNHWYILGASTPKIVFRESYGISSSSNGLHLRICGSQLQSNLTNDADTCALPSEYIIQMTRAILLSQMGKTVEAEQAKAWAERERQRMVIPATGRSVFEV